MEMKTKVVMTAKWWANNKATTLKDGAKLDKAMADYEKASKAIGSAKGRMRFKMYGTVLTSIDAMDKAAAANAKACKKGRHDETKFILTGTFKKEVDRLKKEHEKKQTELLAKVGKLKVADILKDRTMRVLFQQYAKARYVEENINFLIATVVEKKLNEKTYNEFIKTRSKQEINIGYSLRDDFMKAMNNGVKPDKKLWDRVITEVEGSVMKNDLGKANNFIQWFKSDKN